MLTTIAIVLLVLWLLGFVGFHIVSGFIHVLLVLAIIFFLIRIIRGENPFPKI
ncbi:MAG: lmo0937 family membrane protein [bacterium]